MDKKTFWPYGILLSILAVVAACVATIIFASNYPVYEDDSFFLPYQEVKDNYDQLELRQKEFEKNFTLKLDDSGLKKQIIDSKRQREAYILTSSNLILYLSKKPESKMDFKDMRLSFKLTRPHTQENDMFLQEKRTIEKGKLTAYLELPPLSKGRWQLKVKVENEQILGFKSFEFFVR